jgi:hypothetical protein
LWNEHNEWEEEESWKSSSWYLKCKLIDESLAHAELYYNEELRSLLCSELDTAYHINFQWNYNHLHAIFSHVYIS